MEELEVENNETIEVKEFDTGKSLTDKHNVKIINCTFKSNKEDEDQLHLSNCQGCVILKCTFRDKHNAGLALLIDGEKSENNWVVGCTFTKLTFPEGYEDDYKERTGEDNVNAEPIRLGGSPLSGCWFGTTVSWNLFDALNTDVETVSIKSCGNLLEHNIHNDCDSTFAIRHGGYNKIQHNLFKGSGGIRVYGYKNEIRGNYHENNDSKRPPLTVGTGTYENDRNFNDQGEPVDDKGKYIHKKGCSHRVYARAKFNTIADNQYDNCKTCVYWDTGNNEIEEKERHRVCKKGDVEIPYDLEDYLPPTNNSFINNKAKAGNENKDSTFIRIKTPEGKPGITDSRYKNTFQGNKLHNVKRGHLPEEPNDSDEQLQLSKPKAGPDEIPAELEQKLRSS